LGTNIVIIHDPDNLIAEVCQSVERLRLRNGKHTQETLAASEVVVTNLSNRKENQEKEKKVV